MVKAALIVCMLTLILYPVISTGNFNDDNAKRPSLHGAFVVKEFSLNNTLTNKANYPFTSIFFHRNSYIILLLADGKMLDYFFEVKTNNQLQIQDYQGNKTTVFYDYLENGDLILRFNNKQKWQVKALALDWKKLPALKDKIHITVDEIK